MTYLPNATGDAAVADARLIALMLAQQYAQRTEFHRFLARVLAPMPAKAMGSER